MSRTFRLASVVEGAYLKEYGNITDVVRQVSMSICNIWLGLTLFRFNERALAFSPAFSRMKAQQK